MDLDKLYEEIAHVQDEMSKLAADSQQYKDLSEILLNLYKTLVEFEKLENARLDSDNQLKIEQAKARTEGMEAELNLESDKHRNYIDLAKTFMMGSMTIAGILLTVYAEETRAVTSKAFSIATRLIPRI